MFLQKSGIATREIKREISDQKLKIKNNYEETKREVNSKILIISMRINGQYPELSKYLEKMPVTVSVNKKPGLTLKGLSTYYDSLNVLLNYHIKEHPINSTT